MPELPEVETIKNTLKRFVINKEISNVTVHWPKIIKLPDDIEIFKTLLIGQKFNDITRKGKFIRFELDDYVLISHLRMEGKYSVNDSSEPLIKHTHVIFSFTDGEELRYNDVRKFGTMHVFKKGEEFNSNPLKKLGPDPFEDEFTLDYLSDKLKRTHRSIKAALLDQTIIAGLGNIYVDETLFKAGIHPLTKASDLNEEQIEEIKKHSFLTLRDAVKQGGTTIRSYVSSDGEMGMFQQELFVYGQENKGCKNCGDLIVKMKVSGRGTHVCPTCQIQRVKKDRSG